VSLMSLFLVKDNYEIEDDMDFTPLDFWNSFANGSCGPNEVERGVEKTNEYASFVKRMGIDKNNFIPQIAKSTFEKFF
jgi:hypothetical protein